MPDAPAEPTPSPAASAPFEYKPLGLKQTRWYWAKPAFSARGNGVPPDVPHRAQIQRFCNADSAALEEAYRQRHNELEAAWWQEHSELAAGPSAKTPAGASPPKGGSPPPHGNMSKAVVHVAARKQDLMERETSATSWQEFQQRRGSGEPIGLLVRGGMWEVDLLLRLMSPCYWPEAQHRVSRGTWFVEKGPDWVPLRETIADELETAFRSGVWRPEHRHLKLQAQGIVAARVDLATSSAKGTYALFASAEEIYLCCDNAYAWFSRKLGSTTKGPRLRRGYQQPHAGSLEVDTRQEELDDAAAAQPVDRLILAVHGIGQKLSGANIVSDAMSLRNLVRERVNEAEGPIAAGSGGRVELLPVQWRKGLNLGVDKLAETLMPANLEGIRSMLHATAVEVLLYLTPLHCQDMLDSVVVSLNTVYAKFMLRNPSFQGGISIVAHSLGSVLTWDILSCQPRLYAALPVHMTPSGAVDPSLKALERLTVSTGTPASGGHHRSDAIADSRELRGGDSQNSQKNAADATPPPLSSAAAARQQRPALDDVQPLTSSDLNSWRQQPEKQSGKQDAAAAAPADRPESSAAASSGSGSQAAEGAGSKAAGSSADAAEAAGSGSAPDGPPKGATEQQAQQEADPEVPQQNGGAGSEVAEVEQLRAQVAELRSRLQAASAQRDSLLQPESSGAQASGSKAEQDAERLAAGLQPAVQIGTLDFPVDQYIAIGSPLGLFLALRKMDPSTGLGMGTPAAAKLMPGGGGGCDGLPAVTRAFNLYQPYDPVAYRMEPLAVRGGEKRRPVFAPYHRGGRRIHIGLQEFTEDVGSAVGGGFAAAGRASASFFGSLRSGAARAAAAVTIARTEGKEDAAAAADAESQKAAEAEVRARADAPGTAFWRLTEGRGGDDGRSAAGRIDFVLQDSPTENQYLSAISSHFSYWGSADTAMFLARAVSGLDVLTGKPKDGVTAAAHDAAPKAADAQHDGQGQSQQPAADASKVAETGLGPGGGSPRTPEGTSPRGGTPPSPQQLLDRGWNGISYA